MSNFVYTINVKWTFNLTMHFEKNNDSIKNYFLPYVQDVDLGIIGFRWGQLNEVLRILL